MFTYSDILEHLEQVNQALIIFTYTDTPEHLEQVNHFLSLLTPIHPNIFAMMFSPGGDFLYHLVPATKKTVDKFSDIMWIKKV